MFWKKPPPPDEKEQKEKESLNRQAALPEAITSAAPAPTVPTGPTVKTPEDRLTDKFSKIRSALGPGTVIQGRLSFDSIVRIDGKLSGEVFSSRPLVVGPTGQIDAQIEVAALIIAGQVKGTIKAAERIEVWDSGTLEGEISTPVLIVEEGARFSASCVMKK